ncbi:N-acetylmuramoyl-L-alanine amidase [Lachnospiraceae bacterium LCP25S3_G4]
MIKLQSIKRGIVTGIICSLLLGNVSVPSLYAQEASEEQLANNKQQTEVQVEEQTEEEPAPEQVNNQGANLEYLFIGNAQIQIPDTQYILASFGESGENITEATLTYQVNGGEESVLPMDANTEEAILFKKTFTDESQKGEYQLTKLSYLLNGEPHTIDLLDIGIEGKFGVNQNCETNPDVVLDKGQITEKDETDQDNNDALDATILTLDDQGNEVETTTENMGAALQTFAVSDGARARAGGIKIVLDPGHDATHTGASAGGMREEELAFKIAQYCYNELSQYSGVEVYMTRNNLNCSFGGTSITTAQCLQERVQFAKNVGANFFVSLHLNSFYNPSANGAEVYYPNSNYRPDLGEEGKQLATLVAKQLEKLGLTLRRGGGIISANGDGTYPDGSSDDSLYVIRNCKREGIPAILIEHAFMTNANDVALVLNSEGGLRSLGQADASAIAQYFGLVKGEWIQDGNGWWYRYADGSYPKNTWVFLDGKWYHFSPEGYRESGWLQQGNTKYYLNPDGDMVTGWKWIQTAWYCFDSNGAMITGWHWDIPEQKWYYLQSDGSMAKGWITIGSEKYYLFSDGKMATGTQVIDGKTYSFASNGALMQKDGWSTINGEKYYVVNGTKVTGWKWIETAWYYFDTTTSAMKSGWIWDTSSWYYLNPSNGKMEKGWLTIGADKYYLTESGNMVKGKKKIDGVTYYFRDNGTLYGQEGWNTVNGEKYYIKQGNVIIGWTWIPDDMKWFCFDKVTGLMYKGWKWIDTAWYYLEPTSGGMTTGWINDGGKKYYCKSSGEMVTGDYVIDGKVYFFNLDGSLKNQEPVQQTGWNEIAGKKYYYLDGKKVVDWKWIDTAWYYFDQSGVMQTDWKFIGTEWYYLGTDGAMQKGWINQGGVTYYLYSNGIMARGWNTIEDTLCYFTSSGNLYSKGVTSIMGATQTTLEQMVRYYKSSGVVYPAEALAKGGAPSIEVFCQFYIIEAQKEGIKPEVAFAQAMNETGFLKFGGIVKIEQFNFAGIGATDVDGTINSAWFSDVPTGIRAQIQHLKAYSSTENLNQPCCDPRFHLVRRGSAPYVEYLGIKENPNQTGWATSQYYGFRLVNSYLKKLLNS